MSYTPTILIKLEDLEKHDSLFKDLQYYLPDEQTRGGEDGKTVLETIRDLYFEDSRFIVDVFGIKCRYLVPEFSSFNRQIREKLDELNIKYSLIGG